jgi:hypothetical protein
VRPLLLIFIPPRLLTSNNRHSPRSICYAVRRRLRLSLSNSWSLHAGHAPPPPVWTPRCCVLNCKGALQSSASRRIIKRRSTRIPGSSTPFKLIDVGTMPGPTPTYHLRKALDINSNVGGKHTPVSFDTEAACHLISDIRELVLARCLLTLMMVES